MVSEKRLIGCGKGFKHGHFYKPWYRTYKAMMERCYLPTNGNFERYGGKGATVCEEWHDVEVVRCKDCKYWRDASKPLYCSQYMGDCTLDDEPVHRWESDFCSYGERKDNERKAD